jgi:hypothetical protein
MDGKPYYESEEDRIAREQEQFALYQSYLGVWQVIYLFNDLAWNGVAANWAYSKGYFFWHFGRYLGRGIGDLYAITDWYVNYTTLQPYWNQVNYTYRSAAIVHSTETQEGSTD